MSASTMMYMTPFKPTYFTTNHISVSHLRSIKFLLWLGPLDVRLLPTRLIHLPLTHPPTASNSSSAKKSAPSTTFAATPSLTRCFPASADAAPSFRMRRRLLRDRLLLLVRVDTQSQRAWSLDRKIRLRGKIYPDGWREHLIFDAMQEREDTNTTASLLSLMR
jgi:hypothetical protein